MVIDLKKHIIYGPVNSRRLGVSLGLNVLSSAGKVCSFNCIYCQYGLARAVSDQEVEPNSLPSISEFESALKHALKTIQEKPAYITFSGNGEATLHPDFPELVDQTNKLRDRLSPSSKTAILSNSATVNKGTIRKALAHLDVRIMKLDAGNQETFDTYNIPYSGLTIDEIVTGLASMDSVIIQTLITKGPQGNYQEINLKDWRTQLKEIQPLFVQLYTLDRPWPSKEIEPVTIQELEELKRTLSGIGIDSHVFTR